MIRLQRHTILELLLLIVTVSTPICAQQPLPCWDHELKGDSQYPEVDSKCVRSDYTQADRATFMAQIPGSQFKPKKGDNDPVCRDVPAVVTCRTICGDLPAGKRAGGVDPNSESILPGGYARFEQHLQVYPSGNHDHVCLRVKNWAHARLLQGTAKDFRFSVVYGK